MGIYDRLGYSFDTTQFNGADALTPGVSNLLNNSSINLSQWQIDDIANTAVNGYYQNPHNDNLGVMSVFLMGIYLFSNTTNYSYTNSDIANTMGLVASSAQTSLVNFTSHTNNISGVTQTPDGTLYPDLNMALSIGRQMLSITNKSDAVQNNTPILGNFTSLYIANTLTIYSTTFANDYITIQNSMSGANANSSNLSTSTMNTIISDIQSLQTLIDTRKNADISFYRNSYAVLNDYQIASQFSNVGSTQNNLIILIGTDKLKTDLTT